jgi:hypothetical protein
MMKFATLAGLVAALSLTAPAAIAQTFPIKMASYNKGYFKGFNAVVLPSYNMTFITASQATAVGGGARARLTKVLVGVDEETMRKLADEAHADLRAQFTAAGIPVASDETATAMLAANTIPVHPGNRDVVDASGGITLNKSLRQSYVTVGPKAAPLLTPYKTNLTGGGALSMIAFNNRIAKGQPEGTMAVIPTLVLDFANVGASTSSNMRGNSASAQGGAAFTIRGVASGIIFAKVIGRGYIFPFFIRPESESGVATPFSVDVAGAANVAPVSVMGESVARGDAVIVDLPAWEGLVRAAYKSYNSAIVTAALKGK